MQTELRVPNHEGAQTSKNAENDDLLESVLQKVKNRPNAIQLRAPQQTEVQHSPCSIPQGSDRADQPNVRSKHIAEQMDLDLQLLIEENGCLQRENERLKGENESLITENEGLKKALEAAKASDQNSEDYECIAGKGKRKRRRVN